MLLHAWATSGCWLSMSTAKAKAKEQSLPQHKPAVPYLKNPNTNWPFMFSVRPGFVLVNMAPRETTKQRLNKLEEAKW